MGQGKYGPVTLIVSNKKLFALKRIPKESLDSKIKIDHIKQEKQILLLLNKQKNPAQSFIVKLYRTFVSSSSVCFVFEYLSGDTVAKAFQLNDAEALRKKKV